MDSKVVNLSFIVLQCQLNMEQLTENSLRDILSTLFADGGGGSFIRIFLLILKS